MAEGGQSDEIVKRLNDTLECSICMGRYTDPRILDCRHSFCLKCIKGHVGDSLTIKCPLCNDESPTPGSGVEVLKSNFFIRGLIEDVMCRKMDDGESDDKPESKAKICGCCDESNLATSHCDDCECELCADCVQLHAKLKVLKTHQVTAYPTEEEIQSQMEDVTHRLSQLTSDLGNKLSYTQANITQVQSQIEEINRHRNASLSQVQVSQKKMLDMINRYVTELNAQINENADKRLRDLPGELQYYKTNMAAYTALQKQAECIQGLERVRKLKLSTELQSQLKEYKNVGHLCFVRDNVCCAVFVAGTPDYDHCLRQYVGTVESVVRCHIGFLTPATQREKRTVKIWYADMPRKMQDNAVQCTHNALDDHYMNRNTSKNMEYIANHIVANFTKIYRRGNWNCFVWKGILGYCRASKNVIMLNVDNYHICLNEENVY